MPQIKHSFRMYVSINKISAKCLLMPFLELKVHSAIYHILPRMSKITETMGESFHTITIPETIQKFK